MKKILFVLFTFLLLNCNGNKDANETHAKVSVNDGDTVRYEAMEQDIKDSIYSKWIPYFQELNDSVFNEWMSFYTVMDSSFSVNNFDVYNTSEREIYEYLDLGDVNPIYQNCFAYSPNKKQYVDIDSYIWWPAKESNNENQISGFDVDQEILLVDVDAQKKQRLEFFGPSTSVEDAFWVNDHTITLLMWSHGAPAFLVIDLSTNKKVYFQYSEEIQTTGNNNYLINRLQKKDLHLRNEKN